MTAAIKTAVFPVAGLGTRFLPATKVVPKELLPVADRPLIHYAVMEALEAGIEHFVFVTGNHNREMLEAYFSPAPALESVLMQRNNQPALAAIAETVLPNGSFSFCSQDEPLGLGHAVWCAREHINTEPFAVLLPDDLIQASPGALKQMMAVHAGRGGNVVAVEDVPREMTGRYGILDVVDDDGTVAAAKGLVEKPDPADAPSTLSVIGRYLLDPVVLEHLDRGIKGAGGEIQLTDAISAVVGQVPCSGVRFAGRRFDCGQVGGFVTANAAFALRRPDLAPGLEKDLKTL